MLLKRKDGAYFALSVGWNNAADEAVDLMKLIGLTQPMIELVGKSG